MIYVIAGRFSEAEQWAHAHDMKTDDWKYVIGAHKLRGLDHGFAYAKVGTYRDRPDIDEINDILTARGGHPAP